MLSDSHARAISVGIGVPTGIRQIDGNGAVSREERLYDLQGRRVSGQKAKGIYVVNGKKVIVQ